MKEKNGYGVGFEGSVYFHKPRFRTVLGSSFVDCVSYLGSRFFPPFFSSVYDVRVLGK